MVRAMVSSILIFSTISLLAQSVTVSLWTIKFSPDGKYFATGGNQNKLKIYNANTMDLLHSYDVKEVQLSRVEWHPNKPLLAVVTQSTSFKAKILDVEHQSWIELEGLSSSFRGLSWNQDGSLLAVSNFEKGISIFNEEGKHINTFTTDKKGTTAIDWHPSKDIMVAVGSQIGIYNLNGDTLASWEPRSEETFMLCVQWHPSGDFFAVGDYGDLAKADNKMVQFWNVEGELLESLTGSKGEYRNISWSKDGKMLAAATDALRIFDQTGKLIAQSPISENYYWGVDWNKDDTRIITANSIGEIQLWDKNARLLKSIR